MAYELRTGFRLFRSAPVLAVTAVITLAVGIGANTAIFSVIDRVLLHTVVYPHPDRLMVTWNNAPSLGYAQLSISPGDYLEYRERNRVFDDLGAARQVSANLTGTGEPQRISIARATASVFNVLSTKPLIGRVFNQAEDHPQPEAVVVLSSRLAKQLFFTAAAAIGRTITIDGVSYNVVGVMPPSFQFPSNECEAWVPMGFGTSEPHLGHNYTVIGRLKLHITVAEAQSDVASIARVLAQQFPKTNGALGAFVESLQDNLVGKVRPALFVLAAAVGLVLLMACANVANLLLARASMRQTESAVRMALGASRGAIIRHYVGEAVPISLIGGALALVVVGSALHLLRTLVPGSVPGGTEIAINADVLVFCFLVSMLTALISSLASAYKASTANIAQDLHSSFRTTAGVRRLQIRNLLVIGEVALTTALLIAAGLLIKTFSELAQTDPGFSKDSVVTMRLSLPDKKYSTPARLTAFYQDFLNRVRALPGVRYAGLINRLPLAGEESSGPMTAELSDGELRELSDTGWRATSSDYFRTMGITLQKGRDFSEDDIQGRPGVVIVDDLTAQAFWPGQDAVGKRVKLGMRDWNVPWLTVVGVVGHVRHTSLDSPAKMQLYWPFPQNPEDEMSLVTRANLNPDALIPAILSQLRAIDPDQPVSHVSTLDGVVADSLSQRRFTMMLLGTFAAVALTLALLGIYGVLSYVVVQRTREIGVRISLGARREDIIVLVLREVAKLALTGLVVGLVFAGVTSRLLRSLLFGVSPGNPLIWSEAILILASVALLAGLIPAMRAVRIPVVKALRSE